MPRTLSRRKEIAFRAVAVSIPALVGFFVCLHIWRTRTVYLEEVVPPGQPPTHHRFVYDELLGWRNIPGFRSTTIGHSLTINDSGMRGREHTTAKPQRVKRILVLGDSYAWGYGVSDNEVFTEILEEQLAADTRSWEVLNAAVLGWGTDQEYLWLRQEGFNYSPDIVVVALFLLNDPVNNVTTGSTGWLKPVFRDTSLRDLEYVPCPKPDSGAPAVWNHADPIEMTIAILGKISEFCGERNCTLVVMKFGGYLDTGPAIPWLPRNRAYEEIESSFRQQFTPLMENHRGLYYLDLDEAFAARGLDEAKLQSDQSSHWTPLGHRTTADILREYLVNQGLVQ